MKSKILMLILSVSVFPASLFSNTIYFSQVAFGGGYATTIVVVNTGATAISGRLNIYTPNGALRTDLSSQINIAVGGSARVTVPNMGALTTAWAEFIAGSGNAQGVATSICGPAMERCSRAPVFWGSKVEPALSFLSM